MYDKFSRRKFFKFVLIAAGYVRYIVLGFGFFFTKEARAMSKKVDFSSPMPDPFLGIDDDGFSSIYICKGNSPEINIDKVIKMMGGINRFIEKKDIIVLKPNAQRYNQGMTNTDAMKGFIDLILSIPDFSGEIIIAENHQYEKDDCCGWNTEYKNGKFNINELVEHYHGNGYHNVTKYHWHVAGTCKFPLEGNGQGNLRTSGPESGDGYVWMADNIYLSPRGRKCLMTYPVFTSSYSGICIDLKNGAWLDGKYLTDRNVKFINFSALNHHGRYAGVTASVKNLMGVVDMTCGFPGDLPENTFNTHHIGVSKFKHWMYHGHWRFQKIIQPLRHQLLDWCYRDFHHTGGVLGRFMATVRMPDLHIITAELVGWGDRKNLEKAFRPRALLASRDPVALDFVAARDILHRNTPDNEVEISGQSLKTLNNPEDTNGPFYKFLLETHKQGIGNLNIKKIRIIAG